MNDDIKSHVTVECIVNDKEVSRTVTPNTTLLEFIREDVELTGTTEGCGVGVCGCCTVSVDGEPINSCLELAVNVDSATVETIEGLGSDGELDPIQTAFKEEEGFQCGYCTPGMIMMTKAMLDETSNPDQKTMKHYMSENLCRCTGYESIVHSIDSAIEYATASRSADN